MQSSAGKWFIIITRIQQYICVCTVYINYLCINTRMYIFKKICFVYTLNTYLKYICVCIYIINMHSTQTDIM